jgi:glutamate synthase (NADPH) small chain
LSERIDTHLQQLEMLRQEGDLTTFCPRCGESLNKVDPGTRQVWITLDVHLSGHKGDLMLSPKLDVRKRMSSPQLEEGKAVDNVCCPHCAVTLVEKERFCEKCHAPVATVDASVRSKLVPLSICTRVGCDWFGLPPMPGGKPEKGKPKIPRQHMPAQDASIRVRNFAEVTYGFDRELAMVEASRCLHCKKSPCIDGCPVGVDIPGFVRLIGAGEFPEAAQLIRERNALPAICGRVCPQDDQCQRECLLGKKGEALAIGALERFAADFERETDQVQIPHPARSTGFRVACVGSGPSGLTVAADLAMKGHSVTIFEALHKSGGVLVYGIPEFRLPKSIVEAETGQLRHMGVRFEMNAVVGKLYGLQEIFDMGFDAIYLGTGAGLPGFMKLPGENLCNIVSANEYLTRINLMKAYLFPDFDTPAPKGTRVAVIGGGNTAMDCARTALRMGAREANIVYRRTRAEMPARDEEIEHAEQEGVRFQYLTSPIEYKGDEQGWVRQLECVRMQLGEPDASGRARPIPIIGSNFLLDVDMVVVAVGAGPNRVLFEGATELDRNDRGYIRTYTESGRTNVHCVWSGGDIVTGAATVILAMGAGRRAADDIHEYLVNRKSHWEEWETATV